MPSVRSFNRLLSLLIVLFPASARASLLTSSTLVEADIPCGYSYMYPGQGYAGSVSDSGQEAHAQLAAGRAIYGTYIDHGMEFPDMYMGSYDVALRADARAGYGELGAYLSLDAQGGTWLGYFPMSAHAHAEATFEDDFVVAGQNADFVTFVFELSGNTAGLQPWQNPTIRVWEASSPVEYWSGNQYILTLGVLPDHTVHLNLTFLLDYAVTESDSLELDYYNSLRLLSTQTICSWCDIPLTSNQFLASPNRYADVATIVAVPEPNTPWLFAMVLLVVCALRLWRRS